jgi:hypothetical protein
LCMIVDNRFFEKHIHHPNHRGNCRYPQTG